MVCGDIFQNVFCPRRPLNLNRVSLCRLIQTEVNSKVILRIVATSAANLFDLSHWLLPNTGLLLRIRRSRDRDLRSDASSIALLPNQSNLQPIALNRRRAVQQLRRSVDTVDYDIHVAVVVVIAKRAPTRRNSIRHAATGNVRYLFELPGAQVAIDILVLGVWRIQM